MQIIKPIASITGSGDACFIVTGPVPGTNLINLTGRQGQMGDTVAQFFTPSAERVLKLNYSTLQNRVFAYDLSGNLIAEGEKCGWRELNQGPEGSRLKSLLQ